MLKRAGFIVGLSVASVLVQAGRALGQYPPTQTPGGEVAGAGETSAPALPVTGASVTAGMIILAALVLVGVTLLLLGRRRRAGAPPS